MSLPVATQPQAISINEIAWMGDSTNWRNEWIELKNNTSSTIHLDNWVLLIDDRKNILLGDIRPNNFFLIAKARVSAPSLIFKGSLNNNGNRLTLLDPSNRIVDEIDFSSGWPAGDNETKRTLEKSSDNKWQTSLNINGTPGKENSKQIFSEKNLSDMELDQNDNSSYNSFGRIFLKGSLVAFFLTIISLYLNLKIKQYSIKN